MEQVLSLLGNPTLQLVALGCGLLGVISGALGCFAVLRKQSLLGDAISHAAFPGIVLAFLLWRSKESWVLVAGAVATGQLATLAVMAMTGSTRIKYDSALGLVLSVFYGFGVLLFSYTSKQVFGADQAGLDKYLFGEVSSFLESDAELLQALGIPALLLLLLFWKEFKLLCFDPEFGESLGYSMRLVDVLLTFLLVVAIVIGLQIVGVVLMSAMIVAPAAAARQWTDRLGLMVIVAAGFGALAGIGGAVLSYVGRISATGPVIVLCAAALVLVSLLAAPNRGLLWNGLRQWRNRRQLRLEAVLDDLYELSRQHEGPEHGHSIAMLRAMSAGRGNVERSLRELAQRGWARRLGKHDWALTPDGKAEAERLAQTRE